MLLTLLWPGFEGVPTMVHGTMSELASRELRLGMGVLAKLLDSAENLRNLRRGMLCEASRNKFLCVNS